MGCLAPGFCLVERMIDCPDFSREEFRMSDWSSLLPILLPWLVLFGLSAMGRGGSGGSGVSGAGIEVLLIVILVSVAAIALLGAF